MARYQPFNDLPSAQFQGLVEDIRRQGVLLPILVDEDDKTIDGHQRRRAAAEAGVECPRIVVEGLSEEEKLTLALTLNLFRRHLAGVERSKALQQLANLGLSTRRMADITGLSKSTVHRDIGELSQMGQLDRPERVQGADGKSRPATMPERETPPANVDPETGEITTTSGSDQSAPSADAAGPGDDEQDASPAPSPAPKVAPNRTLALMADLSRLRADAAKWMAFDCHQEVIDSMSQEQRDDYRRFLLSMFSHVSATLDYLDAPTRLKAVQ